MKKNGRTLLDDIKLIHRGMNEFEIFLPGQLKLLFVYSAITMLIPYIGICMTSVVISELQLAAAGMGIDCECNCCNYADIDTYDSIGSYQ